MEKTKRVYFWADSLFIYYSLAPIITELQKQNIEVVIVTLKTNKTLLSDVGCTYRAFWRTKYNKIEKNIVSVNAAFAPELTIEFINKGFRVIEIPVNYYPRSLGISKLSGTYIKSGATALKMLKIILQKRFLYLFSK